MLRHAPDPLAALDGDLGAHRQLTDVLPELVQAAEHERQERRRLAIAMNACEGDAVLDVLADHGLLVVDDCHNEQGTAPELRDLHRAVRQEGLRRSRIDREGSHQRLHWVRQLDAGVRRTVAGNERRLGHLR